MFSSTTSDQTKDGHTTTVVETGGSLTALQRSFPILTSGRQLYFGRVQNNLKPMPSSNGAGRNASPSSWTEPLAIRPLSGPNRISDWVATVKTSEKSDTSTNDEAIPGAEFVDPAFVKFETLCKLFPTASRAELKRFFKLYEGDLDACGSALMESGFEIDYIIDIEQHVPTSSPGSSSLSLQSSRRSKFHQPNEDIPKSSSSEKGAGGASSRIDDKADFFDMGLPTDFAKNLLTAFGHPDDESRPLSPEELKIKVSPDIAFKLYKSVYLNILRTELL